MRGTALLLLCAAASTLARAEQPQLTLSGTVCNCNPTEAANVCSQDGSENQLVVHENCNQFYKCSHGSAIPYYCPGILLYSPLAEICDWPENVQCGTRPIVPPGTEEDCDENANSNENNNGGEGNGGEDNGGDNGDSGNVGTCNCNPEEAPAICSADGSDGVLVAHQNCYQFNKCANGVPVTISCPNGLLYNPQLEQCDWPANVDCGDRPIIEIDGGNNGGEEDCDLGGGNGDNGSGSGNGEGSGDNGGGTCNCNPGEAPGICAADGSDGVLVAHENCNQFYKCDHGVPVTQSCYNGLVFNPYTDQCDWPYNVECGDRPIVEIDGGNNGSEEDCDLGGGNGDNGSGNGNGDNGDNGNGDNGSGDNGGTCNCNPGEAPGVCSADGSDGTLVAHENCNQFYKCDHGTPVTVSCPPGLVYNPYIECCDWPANVDCGDKPIVEIEGGGNEDGGGDNESGSGGGDGGNGDNGTGGGTCNCNPGEAPGICGADGSDGTLVAHENCNQFYKCDHGVPVTISCPPGLVYNPYIECCDWPANVDCGDKPIVEIEGGGNGDGGETEGGNGGGGDNGSGNGNSNEENGGGTCNCNPGEAPGICAVDGSDGTLVAHENCNQFYKCDHGAPVTVSCPPDLVYNPYIECCDWPANVDCGDKPIVEIEGGGNGDGGDDNESGSGGGGNGDNGGGNGDNGTGGGTCNCNPGEAPGICGADGSDGTLVAHENCNQFYKCDHGVPVTISCPPGLVYNPYIECCDWPANVDCGDKPIVEIEGGGNGDGGETEGGNGGGGDNGSGNGNSNEENGGGTCNCNPGEAPGICAVDGSDGTLVAHENCNQFYKCDHGTPVTVSCPPGLVYNPYIECCDWPANVDCGDKPIVEIEGGGNEDGGGDNESGSGGGDGGNGDNGTGGGTCNCNPGEAPGICAADGSDGTLVAHENCNQFYKCDHGVPVTISCPPGLVYNPYIECCDWPANVDCGDKPIVEIEGGGNGDGGQTEGGNGGGGDNGSGNGNSNEENGGGTCNCNPGEAPGICAVDGSDGTLVAHENCNQFYKCDHGAPVTVSCPPGLVYNPYIECCDWPANVDCGDKPIVEIEGGGNGDGGGDNESGSGGGGNGDNGGGNGDNGTGGGTCNCNPGEAPGICAADGSDGTLVAHENCNQFYKCDHGVPVTISCPPGLVYNPYIECCDWPANVDCGDKPIVEIEGGGNGDGGQTEGGNGGGGDNGSGNGNSNEENGGGTCNCNPGEAPGICAVDGSDGTLVVHENCNQFYKCDHGAPVTVSCPPGLVYNPYIECCDWPANVDCGDKPIVEIEGGGNGDGGETEGGNGGGGDNGSGNGNSNEENGGGTCNCNPGEAPGICAVDGSDGTLVAHENCNQFYKCDHGAPVTVSCPPGLVYNPYIECCDWPANVDCGDKPIVEIEGGGNGDGGGDNESGSGGGGNGDNGTGGGTCNCNPGEAPGICGADGSDGTLVAHENCNQFYKCDHGVPVTISCPPGLVYNPYIECCDWPANVDCGDKPIVEIEGGGNGDGGQTEGGNGGGGDNGSGNGNSNEENGGGTCNCNPGEAPGICAVDGSDGTLVAHENCNQFYKCDHSAPVTISCAPGLVYNPYIECCDWPANVDCGDKPIVEVEGGGNGDGGGDSGTGAGGGDGGNGDNGTGGGTCNCNPGEAPGICAVDGSDGTLVAHENCNQFYKCDNGAPVTVSCPPGLVYNPYTECCDWPANVDCGEKPIVEVDGGGNGDGGGDSGTGGGDGDNGTDGGNGDNGTGGGTCNCRPEEAPGICGAEGSDGTLVANENCNQFYKCDHGVPVTQNCYPGLMYNPYTEQCDWPANVECGDRPIVEIEEGGNGGGDSGNGGGETDGGNGDNGTGGGTCNCNPGEAPGICGAEGSDGILIAHENCNQFYKCAHGVPVTQNCYPGLMYNQYTEQCDWPYNVECENRPIVEIEGPNSGEDNNTNEDENDHETGNNGDNCDPSLAPSICAASGSDGVLVAHENCNQFYKCSEGVPVVLDCPSTLLYNSVLQVCDWPQNVVCGDRVIPEPEEDNNNGGGDNGGGDNGSGDNGSSGVNSNPSEAPAICASLGSNGVLVAHENCDQFYVCSYGLPVVLDCPSNLLYNPDTEQCDWPRDVDCGDRIIPEPESGGGDTPCSCNAREAPAICAGSDSNGKLIAHENCNQYYMCFNGAPVARSCPQSLFYEPHTEQCLWPASVNCEGRVITAYSSLNKHRDARRGFF